MSLLTLTACLTLSVQAPISQDPQPKVTRFVPVREWIAPAPRAVQPPFGSFLGNPDPDPPILLIGDKEYSLDTGEIADLVQTLANVDADQTGLNVEMHGSALLISGTPAAVQLAEDAARSLTAAMTREVRVQAELFRVPDIRSFPATATNDELTGITSGLQRIWRGVASGQSGETLSLSKDLLTSYVYDVDVEIAQEAKIGDPVTVALFEGVRLAIEPHALTASTDLVVCAQFSFGELRGSPVNHPTGIKDTPSVDVPDLDCNSGAISGRIPNGGALLLSVQGDAEAGSNMLLAITATHDDQRADGNDSFAAYPVSALISQSIRDKVSNAPREDRFGGNLNPATAPASSDALGPHRDSLLLDMIHSSIGFDGDGEMLSVTRKHLLVIGDGAKQQAVRSSIQRMQDRWLKTVRVDIETTMREIRYGNSVFAKSGSFDNSDASRPLHRVTFPALLGRPHAIIRGRETTVISDNDVEVAQKATISDPIVTPVFSGVFLSFYAYPQSEGVGVEAELDLSDSWSTRRRTSNFAEAGDLFLPTMSHARLSHRGAAASGREISLGEGPALQRGEANFRTRQALRVTLP